MKAERVARRIAIIDHGTIVAQGTPAELLEQTGTTSLEAAFLAHDAARLITGETLYIDGGYHIMD